MASQWDVLNILVDGTLLACQPGVTNLALTYVACCGHVTLWPRGESWLAGAACRNSLQVILAGTGMYGDVHGRKPANTFNPDGEGEIQDLAVPQGLMRGCRRQRWAARFSAERSAIP